MMSIISATTKQNALSVTGWDLLKVKYAINVIGSEQ
jgi:hypothetical protein